MMKSNEAQIFLDQSASVYQNTIIAGWQKLYIQKREYLYQTLKQYHLPDKVLELGSADGVMTERLCQDFNKITVVDGSKEFLEKISRHINHPELCLVHSLFEDYNPTERFNTIYMNHIIEHLEDPVAILKRSQNWLANDGRVLIAVPNANSIHRLVGVKLGMLAKKDDLNEQDVLLGHKRVYTPELLKDHVEKGGFKVIKYGGLMIKPISNRQIEKEWSQELINAFFALSEDLPDLCLEIYIVGEKNESLGKVIKTYDDNIKNKIGY